MPKRLAVSWAAAAILAAAGLAACSSSGQSSSASSSGADLGPITYAGSGGSAGAVIQKEINKFTAQTGIKVNYVQGTTSVNYAKVVAQKAHPSVDVLEINPSDLVKGAAQGLFDKINAQEVPAITDLYPQTPASDYGVPQHIAVEGFAYNSAKFAAAGIPPLTKTSDIFNPKLKGHVAMFPPNGNFGIDALVLLAKANGGSASNVAPGFAALKKLKDDGNWTLTPQAPADGDAEMANGTAWVEYTSSTHANTVAAQGAPVVFVSPTDTGGVSEISDLAAVANTGHEQASLKLINFLLSPEAQESQAAAFVGPVNAKAELSGSTAKGVPYGESVLKSLYVLDQTTIAKNKAQWIQEWNQQLG